MKSEFKKEEKSSVSRIEHSISALQSTTLLNKSSDNSTIKQEQIDLLSKQFPFTSSKFLAMEAENKQLHKDIDDLRKNHQIVEKMVYDMNKSNIGFNDNPITREEYNRNIQML